MNKQVIITTKGHRADIGEYKINRILPNERMEAVGPFVFLDHLMPIYHSKDEKRLKADGTNAHPHRGIATLTYVINGEADHNDSNGHHAVVRSGGVQWMKAGNGIVHDESFNVDEQSDSLLTHGMQFWINLPSKNKSENPDYLPLEAKEIPRKELPGNGWIKVITGKFENLVSKIPDYSTQFIYHIHLEAGQQWSLPTENGLEYAVFLPINAAAIAGKVYNQGEILILDEKESILELAASADEPADFILFGGEHYQEPVVAYGPFVMNTEHEISEAYNDFYDGKYGQITYVS
ncbi:pirin family protein [Fluviicola sp.]|uniref:pirin family protein n=1 Tax=Fluviicola sp. TaxID=1917219 RepID=UPI0031D93F9B